MAAAESAADLTLAVLLDPARASRLVQYHARQPEMPSLEAVEGALVAAVAERRTGGPALSAEVERAVEFRTVEALLSLAMNGAASTQARAVTRATLLAMAARSVGGDGAEAEHRAAMHARIAEWERAPEKFVPSKPVEAPPGMPIGDEDAW